MRHFIIAIRAKDSQTCLFDGKQEISKYVETLARPVQIFKEQNSQARLPLKEFANRLRKPLVLSASRERYEGGDCPPSQHSDLRNDLVEDAGFEICQIRRKDQRGQNIAPELITQSTL